MLGFGQKHGGSTSMHGTHTASFITCTNRANQKQGNPCRSIALRALSKELVSFKYNHKVVAWHTGILRTSCTSTMLELVGGAEIRGGADIAVLGVCRCSMTHAATSCLPFELFLPSLPSPEFGTYVTTEEG